MKKSKKPLKGKHTKPNVWDENRNRKLIGDEGKRIDPGVNFFVLMLQAMGCKTRFSCEGHPEGFYVSFKANLTQARFIHTMGFFTVEMEHGSNLWSIRIHGEENSKEHVDHLRWAATSWKERLKPLLARRLQAV